MPIYEYACEKCGLEFEAEQRITDAPLKTCPKCRSRKVKRLISQTSFVLKGGGWYSDLYSTPKDTKPTEGGAKEAGGEGGAGETAAPSDSKGAKKDKKGGKSGSKRKGAKAAA